MAEWKWHYYRCCHLHDAFIILYATLKPYFKIIFFWFLFSSYNVPNMLLLNKFYVCTLLYVMRLIGSLQLTQAVIGPCRYSIQIQMNVISFYNSIQQTTRHLAFVDISVSAFEF